jgi:phage shock protein A
MTGILRRLVLVLKVWAHALLAPAEDPRREFADAYQRQKELLEKVRFAQAGLAASKQRLEARAVTSREKLPRLEDQARQALVSGREDQARFSLQLRLMAVEEVDSLDAQVAELREEERTLQLVEQRLATQIETFFARQEVLAARYDTAEAQVRIKEALGGVSDELAGLGLAVERAQERTEHMQARVSAIDSLTDLGILETPGQSPGDLSALKPAHGQSANALEDHLAALKRELAAG